MRCSRATRRPPAPSRRASTRRRRPSRSATCATASRCRATCATPPRGRCARTSTGASRERAPRERGRAGPALWRRYARLCVRGERDICAPAREDTDRET
eukprot:6345885-Prymnesium_polylepis.2